MSYELYRSIVKNDSLIRSTQFKYSYTDASGMSSWWGLALCVSSATVLSVGRVLVDSCCSTITGAISLSVGFLSVLVGWQYKSW